MQKRERKPLVAGNWKMNGTRSLARKFVDELSVEAFHNSVDIVVCPPSVFLSDCSGAKFDVGSQDLSHLDNGAHTGDISADMLNELNCRYVIVGHSERREDHKESSERVAEKAAKALEAGLIPLICVGEPLSVREAGNVEQFVGEQLEALFVNIDCKKLSNAVIAYEPIWAIGTGVTASPEQAQETHAFIRKFIADKNETLAQNIRIVYGGSVKPDNASELFGQKDVDGGLIGGASLKVEDFIAICQAAI